MIALTFDTHDYVKKLKGVGFSEEQAEVITDLQKVTNTNTLDQVRHEYDLDYLATKRDIKELEASTRRDIKELEVKLDARIKETELKIEMVKAELKKDIAETKADLIRWIFSVVVGMGIIQISSIVFLVLKLSGG